MPDSALPRTGLVLPKNDASDPTTGYRTTLRALGAWLEASGCIFLPEDTLTNRPAAGTGGRFFHATDYPSLLFYDDGTTWQTIGAGAPADPIAATPGLRTLGSGSQQAAPGTLVGTVAGHSTTLAGLGGAAVLNVGTTTGTVAAGDDSRITGAATTASVSDLQLLTLAGAL